MRLLCFRRIRKERPRQDRPRTRGRTRDLFLDPSNSSKVLIRRDHSMIRERISSASSREFAITATRSGKRHQSVAAHLQELSRARARTSSSSDSRAEVRVSRTGLRHRQRRREQRGRFEQSRRLPRGRLFHTLQH